MKFGAACNCISIKSNERNWMHYMGKCKQRPKLQCRRRFFLSLRTIHVNGDLLLWSGKKSSILVLAFCRTKCEMFRVFIAFHIEIDFHWCVQYIGRIYTGCDTTTLNVYFCVANKNLFIRQRDFEELFRMFFYTFITPYAKQYHHYIRFTFKNGFEISLATANSLNTGCRMENIILNTLNESELYTQSDADRNNIIIVKSTLEHWNVGVSEAQRMNEIDWRKHSKLNWILMMRTWFHSANRISDEMVQNHKIYCRRKTISIIRRENGDQNIRETINANIICIVNVIRFPSHFLSLSLCVSIFVLVFILCSIHISTSSVENKIPAGIYMSMSSCEWQFFNCLIS